MYVFILNFLIIPLIGAFILIHSVDALEMKPNKPTKKLNYDEQKILLAEFLKSFEDMEISYDNECYRKYGKKKYLIQIVTF